MPFCSHSHWGGDLLVRCPAQREASQAAAGRPVSEDEGRDQGRFKCVSVFSRRRVTGPATVPVGNKGPFATGEIQRVYLRVKSLEEQGCRETTGRSAESWPSPSPAVSVPGLKVRAERGQSGGRQVEGGEPRQAESCW